MYNVHGDNKLPQASSGQPQQVATTQQKRDRREYQCHYCGLMGHWNNECADFKLHRANQQRQSQAERKQMRMQMQRMHRGQLPPFMHGAQTPLEPIQLGPRAKMMGYTPSQQSMGAGFQGQSSTLQHQSQLSQPPQSVIDSAYGMPSPSMQQTQGSEVQSLRDQVAILQQQLQSLQAPSDLPGGGHATMYAAQAFVNEVHQAQYGINERILDGGTTHHVARSPSLLFSMRSSHINNVLIAGGESHEVVGQGDMLLHTTGGDTVIKDVLCVPTFVANLMSESQIDESGGSVFKSKAKATVKDANGETIVTGVLRDKLYFLECSMQRSDRADVLLVNTMQSRVGL
jgi:hypothetical protein